jgi:hypothetical protein
MTIEYITGLFISSSHEQPRQLTRIPQPSTSLHHHHFGPNINGSNRVAYRVAEILTIFEDPCTLDPLQLCGTGAPSLKPFQDDLFDIGKTLIAIATETEQTAESFVETSYILIIVAGTTGLTLIAG